MNKDAVMGYIIKALEKENFDKELIAKIIYNIQDLEDEIPPHKAQTIYYDFFN